MKYDPNKHHRRSIRLKGYDYTQVGAYYVTIVTHHRECLFDQDVLRRVTETHWRKIPQHFPNVVIDEWIVMPNHLHGIIIITDVAHKSEIFPPSKLSVNMMENRKDASPLNDDLGNVTPLPPDSLGAMIGNFKSVTTRRINAIRRTQGAPVWQRNYYEHIVRNEKEMERIREYIVNNPANWESDEENPANKERIT